MLCFRPRCNCCNVFVKVYNYHCRSLEFQTSCWSSRLQIRIRLVFPPITQCLNTTIALRGLASVNLLSQKCFVRTMKVSYIGEHNMRSCLCQPSFTKLLCKTNKSHPRPHVLVVDWGFNLNLNKALKSPKKSFKFCKLIVWLI